MSSLIEGFKKLFVHPCHDHERKINDLTRQIMTLQKSNSSFLDTIGRLEKEITVLFELTADDKTQAFLLNEKVDEITNFSSLLNEKVDELTNEIKKLESDGRKIKSTPKKIRKITRSVREFDPESCNSN